MDHADHISRTIDLAVAAVRGVDPARYDDPTPCPDFTVAAVVDHIAAALLLAHHSATREEFEWTGAAAPYLVGLDRADWADAVAAQGARTAAAWADPAVWEGESHMAGTPMPAAAIGSMMTSEFAVHAWDVAVATGQRLDVPPALGQVVLDGLGPIAQMGRDGGWFAAEVPLPADAGTFDRALATAGRDPRWTP